MQVATSTRPHWWPALSGPSITSRSRVAHGLKKKNVLWILSWQVKQVSLSWVHGTIFGTGGCWFLCLAWFVVVVFALCHWNLDWPVGESKKRWWSNLYRWFIWHDAALECKNDTRMVRRGCQPRCHLSTIRQDERRPWRLGACFQVPFEWNLWKCTPDVHLPWTMPGLVLLAHETCEDCPGQSEGSASLVKVHHLAMWMALARAGPVLEPSWLVQVRQADECCFEPGWSGQENLLLCHAAAGSSMCLSVQALQPTILLCRATRQWHGKCKGSRGPHDIGSHSIATFGSFHNWSRAKLSSWLALDTWCLPKVGQHAAVSWEIQSSFESLAGHHSRQQMHWRLPHRLLELPRGTGGMNKLQCLLSSTWLKLRRCYLKGICHMAPKWPMMYFMKGSVERNQCQTLSTWLPSTSWTRFLETPWASGIGLLSVSQIWQLQQLDGNGCVTMWRKSWMSLQSCWRTGPGLVSFQSLTYYFPHLNLELV